MVAAKNAQKPEKNAQPPEQPAEQKKQAWMLVTLAVAAILIAALLLWQGGALPFVKTPNTGPSANNTTTADPLADPSAKILLQYMGKQSGLPNAFAIQFIQPTDEFDTSVRLEQNGALRQAIVTTSLYTSRYIWGANKTIGCEKSGENAEMCAVINSTSALNKEASQLLAGFPQDAAAGQKQVDINKRLIEYGAFRFTTAPKAGRYANRSCQDITYALDYSQISPGELQNLQQIEPAFTMPNQQIVRNFRLEQCMDDEFGFAIYSHLSYDALTRNGSYVPIVWEHTMTAFEKAAPNITIPAAQAALGDVETVVSRDRSMGARVTDCRRLGTTNNSDTCLRQSAIEFQNALFCQLTSSDMAMGDCVIKMATQGGQPRPDLCSQAGPKKSECYANIAYIKNDASYCGLVTDPQLKELCIKEVGKTGNGLAINTTINNASVVVRGASQK